MKYIKSIETKIGNIVIIEENEKIVEILRINSILSFSNNPNIYQEKNTKLLIKAKKEIEEYFEGKRIEFDLPLELKGTEFQKKVWKAVEKIPYGKTMTYKEIAKVIGNGNASRAVGMANNKNKIPIIIPCHRVIGSNGKLIGYAWGENIKKYLLDLENNKRRLIR